MAPPMLPAGAILKPVVALNAWTFVMEMWMYSRRLPAIAAHDKQLTPENASAELKRLPPKAQWPAENYNHLHEQPTVFYSVALTLAMLGAGDDPTAVKAAWAYVAVRVVHSVFQSTFNVIPARFTIFISSSAILAGLTAKAAKLVF